MIKMARKLCSLSTLSTALPSCTVSHASARTDQKEHRSCRNWFCYHSPLTSRPMTIFTAIWATPLDRLPGIWLLSHLYLLNSPHRLFWSGTGDRDDAALFLQSGYRTDCLLNPGRLDKLSSLETVVTVSPTVVYFNRCALPRLPATTGPVKMPIRIYTVGRLCCCQTALRRFNSLSIASAQSTAATASRLMAASSVRGTGTPKSALVEFPM